MNPVNTTTNTFCGPAALSIILNVSTGETEKMIQNVRRIGKNRKVIGAYLSELVLVLQSRGYKTTYHKEYIGHSLFYELSILKEDGIYIFCIPGHFIVIEKSGKDRFICDNHTKKPLNAGFSSRLNSLVQNVVRVEK